MKKSLIILIAVALFLFSSCSKRVLLNQDYRVVHPDLNDILADTSKSIGMISLSNSNFQLLKNCPAPVSDESAGGAYENDPRSNKKHDVIEYINIIVKIGAVPNTRI